MAKKMKLFAAVFTAATVVITVLYNVTSYRILLSHAITFGTISYHLVMRLLVGGVYSVLMNNRADYEKRRYRVGAREIALYEKLKVKKWKRAMPTYDPTLFDPCIHTWDEIAQAMCQAELVHETIAVLSFVPILGGIRFGDYPVFIVTSCVAAALDTMFVIMQRYNRPRVVRLAKREIASK